MVSKFSRLFVLISFFLLASCSQVIPEIYNSSSTIVYEFEEHDVKNPSERLCVFLETGSDVRRAETLEIICSENNYHWKTGNLKKYEMNGQQWAGVTTLVMPDGESFSEGLYTAIYCDAQENEKTSDFKVYKNRNIEEANPESAETLLAAINYKPYWAVYDDSDILLFFGEKKESMSTIENVWKKYQNANCVRVVYANSDKTIMVVFPKVFKEQD